MQQITAPDDSPTAGWERTRYAFLAEKERRSGSQRTVQSCSRMLRDFFGCSGKTPDAIASQDVFTWPMPRASQASSQVLSPSEPGLRSEFLLPLPLEDEGGGF
jgi:hypothetical protein